MQKYFAKGSAYKNNDYILETVNFTQYVLLLKQYTATDVKYYTLGPF